MSIDCVGLGEIPTPPSIKSELSSKLPIINKLSKNIFIYKKSKLKSQWVDFYQEFYSFTTNDLDSKLDVS